MNQLVNFTIIILLLLFNIQVGFSQKKEYKIKIIDLSSNFKRLVSVKDSLLVLTYLKQFKNKSISKAYIEAGFDSIIWSDTVIAYFNKGKKYYWGNIILNNNTNLIPRYSFKNLQQTKKIDINNFEKEIEETLTYLENNGYPFCEIKLDSVIIVDNKINAIVKIKKNKLITIDSINIKGNTNTSVKFLKLYLNIKEKQYYNEKKIVNIDKNLNNLSFLNITTPTEIVFYKDKVKIDIFADKNPVNKFDGILGVVPNDNTSGKLAITGELKMLLKNSFGRGETFIAEWQKTDLESQKLRVEIDFPYIFNTIIGTSGLFNLLKQDTSFINIRSKAGINFLLPKNKSISVYIENKTSNLLSISQYESVTVLPSFADTKIVLYGIGFSAKNINRAFSPTKGYILYIEGALGNKNIIKNSKLPSELYDNISLSSSQIEAKINSLAFIKINKNISFKLRADLVYINNGKLFVNELYRFGGLKTLRGFNEDELYADFVTSGTMQLNYYYEEYSSFYIFTDMAYYENHVGNLIHDTPLGIGIGTNFSTKAGIFTISYALGKQFDNPFQFNSSRIHIGYVSMF